jgi:hypothetical protein
MSCQKVAKPIGTKRWGLAGLVLPLLFCQSAFGQTPNTSTLEQLVASYQGASYLEAPNLARGISRALRTTPKTTQTTQLRAQALLALSTQAAVEDRKSLALAKAREALGLMATLPNNSPLRAQCAIAVARAQLLHEDYLAAVTTIVDARRAYGVARVKDDATWERLNLWSGIIQSQSPERLNKQIENIAITDVEANLLENSARSQCVGDGDAFRRDPNVGTEPNYPVASLFDGRSGGVMLRLKLDTNGRVLEARSTAFVPRPGFAAAAEIAAMTWQFNLPATAPPACREDVPFLVSFQLR